MSPYMKAIAAVIVSILGALTVALGTGNTDFGDIDAQTWLIAAASILASGGLVWFAENTSAAPIIKAILGALTAGVNSLIVALDDHVLTRAEQLTALSAFVVGLGIVYQVRNAPDGS